MIQCYVIHLTVFWYVVVWVAAISDHICFHIVIHIHFTEMFDIFWHDDIEALFARMTLVPLAVFYVRLSFRIPSPVCPCNVSILFSDISILEIQLNWRSIVTAIEYIKYSTCDVNTKYLRWQKEKKEIMWSSFLIPPFELLNCILLAYLLLLFSEFIKWFDLTRNLYSKLKGYYKTPQVPTSYFHRSK